MKRALLLSLTALLLTAAALTFNSQPVSAAYNPVEGDLIKIANDSAVYYIDSEGKRKLFVNAPTFWSWYSGSWSNITYNGQSRTIKIISQIDFDNLVLGDHVTVRPGSVPLKFQNSPKIYVSVYDRQLLHIPDESTAQAIFGSNWSAKVITIQNGFENDYIKVNDYIVKFDNEWNVFQEYITASYNQDLNGVNASTLKPSTQEEFELAGGWQLFNGFNDLLGVKNWNKSDFVNIEKNVRQTVISTNPDSDNNINRIIFIVKNNNVLILKLEHESFSIDNDNDGRPDEDETCTGLIYNTFPEKCIESHPGKKDTDGDGWWDGIEVAAESSPTDPLSTPF